jgi:hypothetical protein
MAEDARRVEQLMGGPAYQAALEAERRLDEMMGGPLQRALAENARLVDAMTGGSVARDLANLYRQPDAIGALYDRDRPFQPFRSVFDEMAEDVRLNSERLREATSWILANGGASQTFAAEIAERERLQVGALAAISGTSSTLLREHEAVSEQLRKLESASRAFATPGLDALQSVMLTAGAWRESQAFAEPYLTKFAAAAIGDMRALGVGDFDASAFTAAVMSAVAEERAQPADEADDESLFEYGQRLAAAIAARFPALNTSQVFQLIVWPLLVALLGVGLGYMLSSGDTERQTDRVVAVVTDATRTIERATAPKRYVAVRAVVLRDSPTSSARIVARLPVGGVFEELDRDERGWRYLRTTGVGSEHEGWAYYRNLRPDSDR